MVANKGSCTFSAQKPFVEISDCVAMFSLQLNHRVIKDLSRTLCFQKPAEESAHFRSESSKPQKIGPKVFLEKKIYFPSQDIVVIVTDLKRNSTRTSH